MNHSNSAQRDSQDLFPGTHRLIPGESIRLKDISPQSPIPETQREEAELEFLNLREELIEAQQRLYAESKQALLVLLQAPDAGGKDGTIRHCFRGVNPQGVTVTSFKVPSLLERSHDYLWRVHAAVPPVGMIGIFNRSHYEDVLVVRVDKLVPKSVWKRRYDHINNFEQHLSDEGVRILKFFLHISPEEQQQRIADRLTNPASMYKYSAKDQNMASDWDEYQEAYEDMLNRCSTPWAPWNVIPADQKWYRNLAIMRTLVATLREMNPQYPQPKLSS